MIGKFHLPISGGGALPDPATYCPANGYILNPINPADGWNLLLEFQTNSPYTTTFDPTITASSGEYAWDLGDGTILVGDKSVSHTYLTTATRTVKLYGKGTCSITQIDFNTDNIVGALNVNDSSFTAISYFRIYTNLSLTSVVLPSTITGMVSSLLIYSTGIVGVLDLSKFTTFANNGIIDLHSNSAMTGVTFASSITGNIATLNIYSTAISGILDLSKIATFNTSAQIYLHSNPTMTGVTFPSAITGTITSLSIYSTGITGTLDLSKLTTYTASASVNLSLNTSLTSVTFPTSTITGKIVTLLMNGNTSLGYVDTTKFNTSINSLNWQFQNNGWNAAIVNHILVDIDGISAAGFTGRVINIGGTNADPDSTSGGYDGIAARNSLIAKGFTVTIT